MSGRTGSTVAWTGTEALFLGGVIGGISPPNVSGGAPDRLARDGAAYDPRSRSWRKTAPAPVDMPSFGHPPVIGDHVHLLVDGRLLVYDASDDAWRFEPGPVPDDGLWEIAAAEGALVAARTEQKKRYYPDLRYEPRTRSWTPLPRDPLVPMSGRGIAWTPHGLVLTGKPEVDQPGRDLETSVVRAAVLDPVTDTWRRLPTSDQLGGPGHWTGRRLIQPSLSGADGGEVNGYGRWVPAGGLLQLPEGTWHRLPNAPEELSGGWPLVAMQGSLIATDGYVYDDRDETWTRIPTPGGAPEQAGSAVWAGDALIVFGGYTPDEGYTDAGLSNRAFVYTPP